MTDKKIEPTGAMVENALFQRAWMTPNTTRAIMRDALNHPDAADLLASEWKANAEAAAVRAERAEDLLVDSVHVDEAARRVEAAREQGWDAAADWVKQQETWTDEELRAANPHRPAPAWPINEKKTPAALVWADGDGDKLWARAPNEASPTRSAAYVGASEAGVYLTAAQCHEVAAHFTALADAHEEAMSRSAPALPTEDGAVIIPAEGHEYIATNEGMAHALVHLGGKWYGGASRIDPEQITPGTWRAA